MEPWNDIKYQMIESASVEHGKLIVMFRNQEEAIVPLQNLFPALEQSEIRAIKSSDIQLSPYDINISIGSENKTISWDKIRVLTDTSFSKYLAAQAEEQAKLIGIKLKNLRERKGIKSIELAERSGLTAQTISRIEKGHQDVSFSTLRRLLASMGYSLTDLANEDLLLTEEQDRRTLPQLLKRLSKIGIDPSFITNKIIPSNIVTELKQLENEKPDILLDEAASYVSNVYGWPLNDIWGNKQLSLDDAKINSGILFKKSSRSSYNQIKAYMPYADYLARIVLKANRAVAGKKHPESPEHFIHTLLTEYGAIDLQAALKYAWDLGICIIPLDDSGFFHGAALNINGKHVIILKQRVKSHARWLFDLLHEIYHCLVHLPNAGDMVIEEGEITPGGKDEDGRETEANTFASQVIFNGSPEPYVQEAVKVAKGKLENLRDAVQYVSKKHNVKVDALANYIALRLSYQGDQWWATAEGFQITEPDPFNVTKEALMANLDFKRLNSIDYNLLSTAIKL